MSQRKIRNKERKMRTEELTTWPNPWYKLAERRAKRKEKERFKVLKAVHGGDLDLLRKDDTKYLKERARTLFDWEMWRLIRTIDDIWRAAKREVDIEDKGHVARRDAKRENNPRDDEEIRRGDD